MRGDWIRLGKKLYMRQYMKKYWQTHPIAYARLKKLNAISKKKRLQDPVIRKKVADYAKKYMKTYTKKHAERIKQNKKRWANAHRKEIREYNLAWREKHATRSAMNEIMENGL